MKARHTDFWRLFPSIDTGYYFYRNSMNTHRKHFIVHVQRRIQDLVLGGTKFDKVIWEYYYYCLICLIWNVHVWCRKIKIDLQVITIIWGEETEPLFSLSLCFLSSPFIFLCLFGIFWFFLGGPNVPSAPLWIRQWCML